jgi:hypothetical protein
MEMNEERSSRESRAQSVTKATILIDSLGSSIEVDITSKDSLAKAMQTIEAQTPKGIQVL